jgi:transposase
MAKGKRRAFTKEFKAQTVRLVRDSGKSIGVIARELDLGETVLRSWIRQAEIDAGRGRAGALTTDEREEFTRLRQEVRTLRMERDILKNPRAGRRPCDLLDRKLGARLFCAVPGSRGRPLNGDIASPRKNMVRGWLAHLAMVTPSGDPV